MIIVDDWRNAFAWKRIDLVRSIRRIEDSTARAALRGCTPDSRVVNRLSYLKRELAILNETERQAAQLEKEVP